MNTAKIVNARIAELRKAMAERHLDALIIPSNDPHVSEYVADHWKAREWASGFTGSAGTVVITAKHAGLWTDSRYFLQAEKELAGSEIVLHRLGTPHTPEHVGWILENMASGAKVAIDGQVLSVADHGPLYQKLAGKNLELVTAFDVVAACWQDRPELPKSPVFRHALKYAGRSTADKLADVRAVMAEKDAEYHLLSTLADIAWLFNLRGADVDCNPVFYAYALITSETASLIIDGDKVPEALAIELQQEGVTVLPPDSLGKLLATLFGSSLLYAPGGTSVAVQQHVPDDCRCIEGAAPSTLLKARKNDTEIANIRKVMVKDGIALLKLYRWLDAEIDQGSLTEDQVASQLAAFRAEQADYVGESFDAIAGFQGNGAIVHYRPEPGKGATLARDGIFLLDSGGQYRDGTTDITRTISLGNRTFEQMRDYTLVLKGHIALAKARFPKGTRGYHLDTFARMHLWEYGLDYGHGTGHGVGFFLNVHEGPQSIRGSHKGMATTVFEPGMFTSNEPGRYKAGEYGIRIENLVLCVEAGKTDAGEFLGFETLTLFPIDTQLMDMTLLTEPEIEWINDYHDKVLTELGPACNAEELAWLEEKCEVI